MLKKAGIVVVVAVGLSLLALPATADATPTLVAPSFACRADC